MCFILSTNKYKCCVSRPLLSDRNFENRVTGNAFKKKSAFPNDAIKMSSSDRSDSIRWRSRLINYVSICIVSNRSRIIICRG